MILSSVIIILREALEAALLVSLLLALNNRLNLSKRWVGFAFAIGILGGLVFAELLGVITNWFDGAGQEAVNATLHFLIATMVIGIAYRWLKNDKPVVLQWLMTIAVAAAIVREGSEIWVYYSGFVGDSELFLNTLLGGTIGLCIGISVGALLYYGLSLLPLYISKRVSLVLLAVVGAGMCSQGINSLIQGDFITSSSVVWNSTALVNENSLSGQLLYALIGYEATPSLIQLLGYVSVLACVFWVGWRYRKPLQ